MRKPLAFAVALLLIVACRPRVDITAEPEPPAPHPSWDWVPPPRAAVATMVLEPYRPPPPECEMGEVRDCGTVPIAIGHRGPLMHCMAMADGSRRFSREECNTPLVLAWEGAPVRFTEAPGAFAIGVSARTQWVSAATPWLVLDADASGCIESEHELFGATDGAANGFEKLARLDDDGNGRIDASDAAYARLALWYDRDQDRTCRPSELVSLAEAGVAAIELAYAPRPPAPGGSFEGERGSFVTSTGARGRVVDVYLAPR
jgi:hypothetical protein